MGCTTERSLSRATTSTTFIKIFLTHEAIIAHLKEFLNAVDKNLAILDFVFFRKLQFVDGFFIRIKRRKGVFEFEKILMIIQMVMFFKHQPQITDFLLFLF